MKKGLICYYTETNSTRDYAESIAEELVSEGVSVDVLPINEVKGFDGYDFLVLGAPIQGMQWAKPMVDFAKVNNEALKGKKVAIYFVSYLMKVGRPMWQKAINKSLDKLSLELGAISVGKFEGRVEKPFPKFGKWLLMGKNTAEIDLVDLETSKNWVNELKNRL
ncbi:MAG: flavodoxin domain-containing protein [Spirochaetales bacterium]